MPDIDREAIRGANDEMFLKLRGIRDRACRLQVLVEHDAHRADLQAVADIADRLGVFYAPAQWSKYDEPTNGPQFGEEG
jgi:hypothetical protein